MTVCLQYVICMSDTIFLSEVLVKKSYFIAQYAAFR